MALEERVRALENQLYSNNRKQIIQRYSTDEMEGEGGGYPAGTPVSQTVLTPAAKKQGPAPPAGTAPGLETVVIDQSGKLPSIIQCVKTAEGGRVEVEQIPRLADLPHDTVQAVEIANVPDPETGVTRQYIVTTQMCDTTSKQNLETIVEAIRHLEGDHLFSEESGPHQVVKEEVVESCIIEDNGQVVEMTLPSTVFSSSGIINSLPQVPVSTYQLINNSISLPLSASLPTVPVASLQNTHSTQQVPVTVSNLVSSLQQPLAQANFLPQVPVSLPPVSSLSGSLPSLPVPLELGHIPPPQTSPVNLELGGESETNSPPQSSPVNLAQSSTSQDN